MSQHAVSVSRRRVSASRNAEHAIPLNLRLQSTDTAFVTHRTTGGGAKSQLSRRAFDTLRAQKVWEYSNHHHARQGIDIAQNAERNASRAVQLSFLVSQSQDERSGVRSPGH